MFSAYLSIFFSLIGFFYFSIATIKRKKELEESKVGAPDDRIVGLFLALMCVLALMLGVAMLWGIPGKIMGQLGWLPEMFFEVLYDIMN